MARYKKRSPVVYVCTVISFCLLITAVVAYVKIFLTPLTTFPVKVLVFTMTRDEATPWLRHEKLSLKFQVPGTYIAVQCNHEGLCVAFIGEGKVNAATNVTAILLDKQLSFQNSYFLTSGMAGTPPESGTLGFAAWAEWIVDWDQGSHLLGENLPDAPYGYLPNVSSDNAVFHLNKQLVNQAFTVTARLHLQDSDHARENRYKYVDQQYMHPYVTICDTISGDDFWAGTVLSAEAQYILKTLTNQQGAYCTTEQEDSAVASVLKRFGFISRYLSLRTASNFDQPYAGETYRNLFSQFPAKSIAIENAYIVGSAMVHYLMKNSLATLGK